MGAMRILLVYKLQWPAIQRFFQDGFGTRNTCRILMICVPSFPWHGSQLQSRLFKNIWVAELIPILWQFVTSPMSVCCIGNQTCEKSMKLPPFQDDVPIKSSIDSGFPSGATAPPQVLPPDSRGQLAWGGGSKTNRKEPLVWSLFIMQIIYLSRYDISINILISSYYV
jgi:hypothetical protein